MISVITSIVAVVLFSVVCYLVYWMLSPDEIERQKEWERIRKEKTQEHKNKLTISKGK